MQRLIERVQTAGGSLRGCSFSDEPGAQRFFAKRRPQPTPEAKALVAHVTRAAEQSFTPEMMVDLGLRVRVLGPMRILEQLLNGRQLVYTGAEVCAAGAFGRREVRAGKASKAVYLVAFFTHETSLTKSQLAEGNH